MSRVLHWEGVLQAHPCRGSVRTLFPCGQREIEEAGKTLLRHSHLIYQRLSLASGTKSFSQALSKKVNTVGLPKPSSESPCARLALAAAGNSAIERMPTVHPQSAGLPASQWVRLCRMQTGYGRGRNARSYRPPARPCGLGCPYCRVQLCFFKCLGRIVSDAQCWHR